jgi:hypothetical protein
LRWFRISTSWTASRRSSEEAAIAVHDEPPGLNQQAGIPTPLSTCVATTRPRREEAGHATNLRRDDEPSSWLIVDAGWAARR